MRKLFSILLQLVIAFLIVGGLITICYVVGLKSNSTLGVIFFFTFIFGIIFYLFHDKNSSIPKFCIIFGSLPICTFGFVDFLNTQHKLFSATIVMVVSTIIIWLMYVNKINKWKTEKNTLINTPLPFVQHNNQTTLTILKRLEQFERNKEVDDFISQKVLNYQKSNGQLRLWLYCSLD